MEMVTLQKMSAEEFALFQSYSISQQAKDLANSASQIAGDVLAQAEREFTDILPEGIHTPNNYLMKIIDCQNNAVGVIWYLFEQVNGINQCFIADFIIKETARGKGYGKSALFELEKTACAEGCEQCLLYVYRYNVNAFHLYENIGFRIVETDEAGMYMKKLL